MTEEEQHLQHSQAESSFTNDPFGYDFLFTTVAKQAGYQIEIEDDPDSPDHKIARMDEDTDRKLDELSDLFGKTPWGHALYTMGTDGVGESTFYMILSGDGDYKLMASDFIRLNSLDEDLLIASFLRTYENVRKDESEIDWKPSASSLMGRRIKELYQDFIDEGEKPLDAKRARDETEEEIQRLIREHPNLKP